MELSSGNVFADLGFEDADERMLKAQLAIGIDQLDRGEYVEYASAEEMFEDIAAPYQSDVSQPRKSDDNEPA